MKTFNTLVLLIIIFCSFSCKQGDSSKEIRLNDTITIDMHIRGFSNTPAVLSYEGITGSFVSETIKFNAAGKAKYVHTSGQDGIYKLLFGKSSLLLLINNEDIAFNTFVVNSFDSVKFSKSIENQTLYEGLRKSRELDRKLSVVSSVLTNYPLNTDFYNNALKVYTQNINEYDEYLNRLGEENPGLIAPRYLSAIKVPYPETYVNNSQVINSIRENFFTHINFNDTALLKTNLYVDKINQYLSLYKLNKQHTTADEFEYIKAVDNILKHAVANNEAFNFIVYYLVEKFEDVKAHETLAHINKTYVPQISCVNEALKEKLSDRLNKFENTSIGSRAPYFSIADKDGNVIDLSSIESDKLVLVFWATWCPHCTSILPQLHKYYKTVQGLNFKVVAVSLDNSKDDWKSFISQNNFTWYDVSELKGWDSKMVMDYNIYATPTIIVLNANREIVGKPLTISELDQILRSI